MRKQEVIIEDNEVLRGLKKFLEDEGFKIIAKSLPGTYEYCKWDAFRNIGRRQFVKPCLTNERNLQLQISPALTRFEGKEHISVTVIIRGEANVDGKVDCEGLSEGYWANLKFYGLSANEVMRDLYGIEARLICAWNAASDD
jgi:hypothetical protein